MGVAYIPTLRGLFKISAKLFQDRDTKIFIHYFTLKSIMNQIYVQFQVDNVEIELAIIKYTNIATQTQIPGQLQNTSIWGRSIIEHTLWKNGTARDAQGRIPLARHVSAARSKLGIPSRTLDNLGTCRRREQ